jgi:hypothetical protein
MDWLVIACPAGGIWAAATDGTSRMRRKSQQKTSPFLSDRRVGFFLICTLPITSRLENDEDPKHDIT